MGSNRSQGDATAPHRSRVLRPVTTALLMLAVALAACSGENRSVEAFCERLDEGDRSIRAIADDTEGQDNPLLALAVMLGGVGEYQAMVDDLAGVAPEEIRSEMERARDSFQRQSDATAGAGSVTEMAVGAIGGMIDGLTNRTAFEAVDSFAIDNCGRPVFALSAAAAGGPSGDTAAPLAPEDDPCPGLPNLHLTTQLDSSAGLADTMVDALEEAQEFGVEGLDDIATAVAALEPAPSSVLEALARVGWDEGGERLAERVNEATDTTCGRSLIATEVVEALQVTGPRHLDGGQFLLGTYDPSCTGHRFSATVGQDLLHTAYNGTHVIVWPCGDAPVVVSMEDGTSLLLGAADQFDASEESRRRPMLTDSYVFWTIREEVPPTGLDDARKVDILFRRSLTAPYALEEVRRADAVRDSSPTGWAPGMRLMDAVGEHVLLRMVGEEELVLLHEDGTELRTVPHFRDPRHLIDGIWHTQLLDAPLLDVRTNSLVYPDGADSVDWGDFNRNIPGLASRDQCATRMRFLTGPFDWVVYRASDGGVSVRGIEPGGVAPLPAATVGYRPGPSVYDLDGELIWETPADRSWRVFGGALYAAAEDGTIFEVNPFNDELTTPTMDPVILEALFAEQGFGNRTETVHVHRETGDVVLYRNSLGPASPTTDQLLRIREGVCAPS